MNLCFPESLQLEFKNKNLHVQSQRTILNIYSCLKSECDSTDWQIVKRICELTKLSCSTVDRVIKSGEMVDHTIKRKRIGQKLKNVDLGTKENIRRIVYEFYKENRVPTLEMIRTKLTEFPTYNYKSLDSLRNILMKIGFSYKKLDKSMIIMESARIVQLRQDYLRHIKQYRDEGRSIIYLDETWFDTHDVIQYGWTTAAKIVI